MLGRVMHERVRPVRNRFVYPVFCVRFDLSRLPTRRAWWFGIGRLRLLGIDPRDYGSCDGSDLLAWVRGQLVQAGLPDDGRIWLQTFPRVLGYAFNPVSFWLCEDRDGNLRALIAEVRNTFDERHRYLLRAPGGVPIDSDTPLDCAKTFHVSPFCRVEGRYVFRVRETRRAACIAIDYHDNEGLSIRTSIGLRKTPLTAWSAVRAVARQPWLTFAVVACIHWQALRLWLRGVPFYGKHPPPPASRDDAAVDAVSPTQEQVQR
ncbi:DUF1365 domain-containing protein [Trinickia dabaoshanensis]|uniref:DUF1365 domain-containing protein n=1 Tax=Trinickia dabaoshanensis TaxID=564714 RepID=A0A2N7VBF3_9BURK|nr:DUF1365 domain-containing protein [Trinickia dabaoshanensis]PMS14491.1 DUF1365 domain-containing protein [Trinickia dabaoshanensis]